MSGQQDDRWIPEMRAALERRDRWLRGFRIHLVRTHHTNNVDACGCRLRWPPEVFFYRP